MNRYSDMTTWQLREELTAIESELSRRYLAPLTEREPNAAVAVGPTCPANICLTPKGCALYGCKLESAKTGASDE